MNHQIKQQYIEVEFSGTEAEGLEIQRMLPDLYYHELLPAIEKAFDQSFPADLVLKIDRIEVNAGTLNLDKIGNHLTDAVVDELIKVINTGVNGDDASLLTNAWGNRKPMGFAENLADVLIYFLRTGSLPWSFRLQEGTTLEDELLKVFGKGSGSEYLVTNIKEIGSNHDAVKRLVNQFTYPCQSMLLRILSPEIAAMAERIYSHTDKEALLPEIRNEFRKCLFESAFGYSLVSENPSELGLITQLSGILPARLNRIAEISGILHPDQNSSAKLSEGRQNGKSNSDYLLWSKKEGFYIDNAGLVILYPFLPRFFETLGIMNDDKIISPSRALSLLNYLTTGQTAAPEYLLILPKILCGIPILSPVISEENINSNESDESMALLTAVILHWSALRNTSPDTLRETFLKRRGKLYQENGVDWILKVESQTFDVLLDQLPWGIGLIKLPWMQQILRVEWVN
jgi:hypothetical protein